MAPAKMDQADLDTSGRIPSAEVSDPSEVPWFVQELIFKVVEEVKLICVPSIILIVIARTSNNLVCIHQFPKKYQKCLNTY